jgi:hypothetical protein
MLVSFVQALPRVNEQWAWWNLGSASSVVYLWFLGCFGLSHYTPSPKAASDRVINPTLSSHSQLVIGLALLLIANIPWDYAWQGRPPPWVKHCWPHTSWPSHSGAQLGSFHFIQSHWLLPSAASDTALIAERWLWPLIPRSLSSLVVDVATKPLQPTSTGWTSVFQPWCRA